MFAAEGQARADAAELRRRARSARDSSRSLRERSERQRDEVESLAAALAEALLRSPAPLGDDGDTFSLRLARVPSAVGVVRRHLGRWLERADVESEAAFDVALACSEACANAVEHPLRPRRQAFEIRARRSAEGVEVVVSDYGDWSPGTRSSSRGRGLAMIRRLMDSAAITRGPDGARVVMRRACGPRRPPRAPA